MEKSYCWSPSGLKSYETCARQFHAIRVEKSVIDTPGPAAQFGTYGHKAFEEAVRDGKPLPADLRQYTPNIDKLLLLPGTLHTEHKVAVKADWTPTDFDADDAWHRGIIDLLALDGRRAGIIDFKFGKPHRDMTQLIANALCVFSLHREVQVVFTRYWWIAKGGHTTNLTVHRSDARELQAKLRARVARIDTSFATGKFPPNPSGLCRQHCGVLTCEFNGRKKKT